jgi:predicted phosphodiesterase
LFEETSLDKACPAHLPVSLLSLLQSIPILNMTTRRIRIVCISDTHNQTPKLPSGDILIHAGDLTNQGTFSELQKTLEWIKQSKFQVKIVVCGNHDITCDKGFYQQYGGYFHNKRREDSQLCLDLFASDPSILYLNHESKPVVFKHEDGQLSKLKVFGSPYSPAHGFWAFGYPPESASALWDQIPLDTDIVITHTPPKFHLDECGKRGTAGCEVLRQTLWRVRPRLFVCGHIHEAYGVEVIHWDLSSPNVRFKEQSVRTFADPDPSSKKQFMIDLSKRAKSLTLKNDGAAGDAVEYSRLRGAEADGPSDRIVAAEQENDASEESSYAVQQTDDSAVIGDDIDAATLPEVPRPSAHPFPGFDKADRPVVSPLKPSNVTTLGTIGQGGPETSARSDQEAISGRSGRMETCVVNAAFMASNFPHKAGKRFHKPIVIDMDFPACGR